MKTRLLWLLPAALTVAPVFGRTAATSKSVPLSTEPQEPATSAMITAASPRASLPGVASVDLSNQPALRGAKVWIAEVVDLNLNAAVDERDTEFEADLQDPRTLRITLSRPPSTDVAVVVDTAGSAVKAANGKILELYSLTLLGSDAGTGVLRVEPLHGHVNARKKTIAAPLPWQAFHPTQYGTYVANLKLGMAPLIPRRRP